MCEAQLGNIKPIINSILLCNFLYTHKQYKFNIYLIMFAILSFTYYASDIPSIRKSEAKLFNQNPDVHMSQYLNFLLISHLPLPSNIGSICPYK